MRIPAVPCANNIDAIIESIHSKRKGYLRQGNRKTGKNGRMTQSLKAEVVANRVKQSNVLGASISISKKRQKAKKEKAL